MYLSYGTIANKPKTLKKLLDTMSSILENPSRCNPYHVKYSEEIESFISSVSEDIYDILPDNKKYLSRWVSLKLLDENSSIDVALKTNFGCTRKRTMN